MLSGVSLDGRCFIPTRCASATIFLIPFGWPKEQYGIHQLFLLPSQHVAHRLSGTNHAYTGEQKASVQPFTEAVSWKRFGRRQQGETHTSNRLSVGWAVLLTIEQAPKKKTFSLYLRVPEWCDHATLKVNGEVVKTNLSR